MEPHLNGSNRDAESFGGLLHVAVFHLAEHEDLAVGQRKRSQSLTDERADLLAFKSLQGNLAPVSELHGGDFAFSVVVERIGEPGLDAAKAAASLVEDDADEPCAEASFGTEAPEVSVCLEECILRGILSLSLVVEQRKRHEVNAALVRTDQLVKEFVVAGEDVRYHPGFVPVSSR